MKVIMGLILNVALGLFLWWRKNAEDKMWRKMYGPDRMEQDAHDQAHVRKWQDPYPDD